MEEATLAEEEGIEASTVARPLHHCLVQAGAAAQPPREGACKELGPHVFDFGSHDSADLLTTSWDALKVHVGTKYNEDIKMELENGNETIIPLPKLSEELTRVHKEQWEQKKRRLERILRAKEQAETVAKTKL
jgi:hypothetical protein